MLELLQVKDLTLDQAITKCSGIETHAQTSNVHQSSMWSRQDPLEVVPELVLVVVTNPMMGVERTVLHTKRHVITVAR